VVALADLVRGREPGLPHGELAPLRRPLLRTAVFRVMLGLALVGLLGAALAVALGRDARPDAVLPAGTTGMIVLDLSASTGAQPQVGELFRRVAAADEPTGVLVFSDTAYELVPPGTPGRDLAPMVRFFTPRPDGTVPRNPWSAYFSGGTSVSAGLEAAQTALERDRIARGSILLVSDLEFVAEEIARVPILLTELRREGVELRVLPVAAREEQRQFFARVAGPEVFVDLDDATSSASRPGLPLLAEERMPWLFVALAAILLVLLAANERLCGRLRLSAPAWRTR
jgi:hypothetical protein